MSHHACFEERKKEALHSTELVVQACSEAKGSEITVLDVSDVFQLSDYFVVVSGRSDRQSQGICNRIIDTLEKKGEKPISVEGYDEGHWIVLDYGEVVVHVFYGPTREAYDLEGLWTRAKRLTVEESAAGETHLRAA